MNYPDPEIAVQVDVTNPGQFFACCGLLELAHRLWPDAEAWFHPNFATFEISAPGSSTLHPDLVGELRRCAISETERGIIQVGPPFNFAVDWWEVNDDDLKPLKTWAGQQNPHRIACAARNALPDTTDGALLNFGAVMRERKGRGQSQKVEPFYFDARRFAPALDMGFSLDAHDAETTAHPAVELLCFIGLQRFRPSVSSLRWHFEYSAWVTPLRAPIAAAVASCAAAIPGSTRYRFSTGFRDNQKRYKSFGFAAQIPDWR